MDLHSRTGNGTASAADVEAGACWAEGLKLRSRPSSTDLNGLAGSAAGWEDRPLLFCSKPKSAASLAAAAAGGSSGLTRSGSPRASPLLGAALRRSWRRSLSALLALTLALVLLLRHHQLYRNGQDLVAKVYYGLDPMLLGRREALFPAPYCCRDESCSGSRGGGSSGASTHQTAVAAAGAAHTTRVAVVTYLRDDSYLPLLQQLECTLRRTNPQLELGLMHVEGELAVSTLDWARTLNITLLPVEPLDFPNSYEARYGRNWLKVRALGLTQYDAVLLVDSDIAVVSGGLGAIFSLPAEFAAVWDQSKWLNRWRTVLDHINGGVFLLRPCAAVEAHMVALLDQHPKLRFVHGTAEQDFFGWYYRYTGVTLPLQWNCQADQCLESSATVGGARPKIVHYTGNKPFSGPRPGSLGHEFLCSVEELRRRVLGEAPAAAAAAGAGAPGEQQEEEQQQAGAQAASVVTEAAAEGQGGTLAQDQQQQQQQQQQPVGSGPAAGEMAATQGAPLLEPAGGRRPQQQPQGRAAQERSNIVQQGDRQLPGR